MTVRETQAIGIARITSQKICSPIDGIITFYRIRRRCAAPAHKADKRAIMMRMLFNPRYPKILLVLFLLFAGAWAIHPKFFSDWMLENALTAIFVLFVIITYKR